MIQGMVNGGASVESRFNFAAPPLDFLRDGKLGFNGSKAFGNNVVQSVGTSGHDGVREPGPNLLIRL